MDVRELRAFDLLQPIRFNDTPLPDSIRKSPARGCLGRARSGRPVVLAKRARPRSSQHRAPRVCSYDEVSFLQSIARHLAIGSQYTASLPDKQREAERRVRS